MGTPAFGSVPPAWLEEAPPTAVGTEGERSMNKEAHGARVGHGDRDMESVLRARVASAERRVIEVGGGFRTQLDAAEVRARALENDLRAQVAANAVARENADCKDLQCQQMDAEILRLKGEIEAQAREARDAAEEVAQVRATLEQQRLQVDDLQHIQGMNARIAEMHEDIEVWKQQPGMHFSCRPKPHLVAAAQTVLRTLRADHTGECDKMRHVEITSVEEVVNVTLWKKYLSSRQTLMERLLHWQECPWIDDQAPVVEHTRSSFPHITLERNANEILLLHGTKSAAEIAREGFDDRLNERSFYGVGNYFSTDHCKVQQYYEKGSSGCVILARVLLGHPFEATGQFSKKQRRPPNVPSAGIPYDSTIAKPGTRHANGNAQRHLEFIAQREYAYPELLIHFRYA